MAQLRTCPDCGANITSDAPDGACPACALRGALSPMADLNAGTRLHYFADYEIIEEIGRGGMGVVFRARQVSLNRDVALKMILTGRLASESEVNRFIQEAQAAAGLRHPNIVEVYEVSSYQGHHYYSMELIEGQNLAELVKEVPMPARKAAECMKAVADAIHFAHERGTLHRDLKPTNILIDVFGLPRITDFGLARREQIDAHLTTSGQVIGTPAFISPEQAQGSSTAIGPRSDLYSAGAVLYYMLTQRAPFAADSLAALLDLVVHQDPVSPRALNPSIPRDLETICLKCLEKDQARRYSSAKTLSEDLDHFIRAEPVIARPTSAAHRAWRWCARNRTISGSIAAIAFVLVAGVLVSTRQALRAKAEAAKSKQTAQFLQDMLQGVGPSVALGHDTTMLREILDKTAMRIDSELKAQPEVREDLQAIIGNVYNELGLYEKAEEMHRKVLATATTLWGSEHLEVANALINLANALQGQGKLPEAEALDRRALAVRKKRLGNDHPDVAMSLEGLAEVLGLEGKLKEAEASLREVVTMQKKLLGNEHLDVATSVQNLGQTLRVEGRLPQAESLEREALSIRRKRLGDDHPDVATSLNGLAIVLDEEGKFDEAERMHRQALALRRKFLDPDHPLIAESLNNLASVLSDENKLAESETAYIEALRIEKKVLGAEHREVANSLNNLALLFRDEGKLSDAEQTQREALAVWRKSFGLEHPQVATALNNLAAILRDENKLQEAETDQRAALAMQQKLLGTENSSVARSLYNLGGILSSENKLGEAEEVLQEAVTMRRKLLGAGDLDVAAALERQAEVMSAAGRLDEEDALLRECLAIREQRLPDGWPTFNARSELGGNRLEYKKYAEAEPMLLAGYNGLNKRAAKIPAWGKHYIKDSIQRLIRFYEETARVDEVAKWKQRLAQEAEPVATTESGAETQKP